MRPLTSYSDETWDRFFDWLADGTDDLTSEEVRQELADAGIDMAPACERLAQAMARRGKEGSHRAMGERWFHVEDHLYFVRHDNGWVTVCKTDGGPPGQGRTLFEQRIADGAWGSVVLSMTVYNERPGDWHKWMDHHHGRADLMKEPSINSLEELGVVQCARELMLKDPEAHSFLHDALRKAITKYDEKFPPGGNGH